MIRKIIFIYKKIDLYLNIYLKVGGKILRKINYKSITANFYYLVNYHLKIILIKIIIYHQNQHQKKHILNLKKANSHK